MKTNRQMSAGFEREIRAELEFVVQSAKFGSQSRLPGLLRYLVDTELCGGGEHIKAYTIAVDFFGRSEDFDPSKDSIVRVEMGRLRRAIQEHYQSVSGQPDILIDIPKGKYRPYFTKVKNEKTLPRALILAVALVFLFMASVVGVCYWISCVHDQKTVASGLEDFDGPRIVVLPFVDLSGTPEGAPADVWFLRRSDVGNRQFRLVGGVFGRYAAVIPAFIVDTNHV